jgi:acyl-CoA thioesterase FadM
MNLLLRLVAVMLASLRGARLGPLDVSVLRFRVWPNDLDLNLHMNNGRYLSVMDLGRFDLLARMGVMGMIVKNGWRPMVGGATIRFRRPLAPFAAYELRSRIVCWDEKWFYIEQRFEKDGQAAAVGLMKGLFRAGDRNVTPTEVMGAAGAAATASPPMPAWVRLWLESEAASRPATAAPLDRVARAG